MWSVLDLKLHYSWMLPPLRFQSSETDIKKHQCGLYFQLQLQNRQCRVDRCSRRPVSVLWHRHRIVSVICTYVRRCKNDVRFMYVTLMIRPFSCITHEMMMPWSCVSLLMMIPSSCITLEMMMPWSCVSLLIMMPPSCVPVSWWSCRGHVIYLWSSATKLNDVFPALWLKWRFGFAGTVIGHGGRDCQWWGGAWQPQRPFLLHIFPCVCLSVWLALSRSRYPLSLSPLNPSSLYRPCLSSMSRSLQFC